MVYVYVGVWQAMSNINYGYGDYLPPGPNQTNCVSYMREFCQEAYQQRMMAMSVWNMTAWHTLTDTLNQTIAGIIRVIWVIILYALYMMDN